MQIRITGANMDVGGSLTTYVEENLEPAVKKYFENAVDAEVHFSKHKHMFKVMISVNEGVKGGGIVVKSNAEAGDVYGCFNEACQKVAKQLRRYKRKIVNFRRQAPGIKDLEPDFKALGAKKYILPPNNYDIFEEMENEEEKEKEEKKLDVVSEKTTNIEKLSVDEAIMKMDLADLPALVFINSENNRINVVYYRKDGNISWIDPNN